MLFRAVHEEYDWIFPVWNQLESATRGRPDVLTLRESEWRDLYHYLLDHGYEMRGRYQPGWIPSWIGTGLQVLKLSIGNGCHGAQVESSSLHQKDKEKDRRIRNWTLPGSRLHQLSPTSERSLCTHIRCFPGPYFS